LSPCLGKCKQWTRPEVTAALKLIAETAQNGTKPALNELEQGTGFRYEEDGLMFDEFLADYINSPTCVYVDWMHCWCSSGGVGQHHVNQYVLAIQATFKMSLQELDVFAQQVILPSHCSKLTKTFFTDRIVDKSCAHLKGFAADVLSAVHVLGILTQVLVRPSGLLAENVVCFQKLQLIFAIYKRAAVEDIPKARAAVLDHHELYCTLYPDCKKPKVHQGGHVNDSWEEFQVLISCFGAEADHKHPKRIFNFAYNDSCSTALHYGLRELFAGIADPHTFEPTFLGGKVHASDVVAQLGAWGTVTICATSLELVCPRGRIRKNDLLHWKEDGIICIGIARGFIDVKHADSSHSFAAIMLQHRHVGEGAWVPLELAAIGSSVLESSAVPYIVEDGRVIPLYIH
jgi:hypothetical protein